MSVVSCWVLSILGVIVLSILVEMILPNSTISKFIKNIFGYLIIIIILSPVFTFFSNKNFDINSIFETSSVSIQEDFVANVNRQVITALENSIIYDCKKEGILNIQVGIEANIFETKLSITQINVDIKNLVIQKNYEHKNIKTSITDIILDNVVIDRELIVFYE